MDVDEIIENYRMELESPFSEYKCSFTREVVLEVFSQIVKFMIVIFKVKYSQFHCLCNCVITAELRSVVSGKPVCAVTREVRPLSFSQSAMIS